MTNIPHTHIDALITAGLYYAEPTPLTWAYHLRGQLPKVVDTLTTDTATTTGRMLLRRADAIMGSYEFRALPGLPDLTVTLNGLRWYRALTEQFVGWPISAANAFCHALEYRLICQLRNHKPEAPITDRDVFTR